MKKLIDYQNYDRSNKLKFQITKCVFILYNTIPSRVRASTLT